MKATSLFSWVPHLMRLNTNSSAAPSRSRTEIRPECRKFWESPTGLLYGKLERYEARHKSKRPIERGTDTARRAMIASRERTSRHAVRGLPGADLFAAT